MSKKTKYYLSNEDKKREKVISTVVNPESYDTYNPSWRFCKAVEDHKWSINRLGWALFSVDVYPKLKEFEKMTWNKIKSASKSYGNGSKSHNIPIENFPVETQKELELLKLIDIDELFSLRLDGRKRIYGILQKGVLEIIWYDDKHEIYPVK